MDVSRYMYVMSSESVAMEPTSTFKARASAHDDDKKCM